MATKSVSQIITSTIDQSRILVVFDLDDTLYKESDYVTSGQLAVARRVSRMLRIPLEDVFKAMKDSLLPGNPFDRLYQYVSGKISIDMMVRIYREHIPMLLMPADSRECLDLLKTKGITLGLITDGRHSSQWNKIRALGLTHYIDPNLIIVSEDAGGDKLTPTPWELIEKLTPQCTSRWYIGDNPAKDFLIPNSRGWHTVMLENDGQNIHSQIGAWTSDSKAQYVISSLKELPKNIVENSCN